MTYFERFRRTNDNVFDMQEMKQQMEREESEAEIQKVVHIAVERIDKRKCFEALKEYYLNHGKFPNNHYTRLPSCCSIPIDTPKVRLQPKYIEYGKNIGNGVYLDKGGIPYPNIWRVYITHEYFESKHN